MAVYSLKDKIFSYFTNWDTRVDVNKDVNNKGTLERYMEMVGEDADQNLLVFIDNLLSYTLIPDTVISSMLPYLESSVGLTPISSDLNIRRRVLRNIINIYKTKGTSRSYELVFKSLGFSEVSVIDQQIEFGLDSPITFDDNQRTFDLGKCYKCKFYTLQLTGVLVIDDEMRDSIAKAINLVEPIYANLFDIVYNGSSINDISIFVGSNGDLVYTEQDSVAIFELLPNGDLKVTADNANDYNLDNEINVVVNG